MIPGTSLDWNTNYGYVIGWLDDFHVGRKCLNSINILFFDWKTNIFVLSHMKALAFCSILEYFYLIVLLEWFWLVKSMPNSKDYEVENLMWFYSKCKIMKMKGWETHNLRLFFQFSSQNSINIHTFLSLSNNSKLQTNHYHGHNVCLIYYWKMFSNFKPILTFRIK